MNELDLLEYVVQKEYSSPMNFKIEVRKDVDDEIEPKEGVTKSTVEAYEL